MNILFRKVTVALCVYLLGQISTLRAFREAPHGIRIILDQIAKVRLWSNFFNGYFTLESVQGGKLSFLQQFWKVLLPCNSRSGNNATELWF